MHKYSHIQQSKYCSYEKSFSYEQLINYYPRHHLIDELLNAHSNVDHINFFFDLKNIMQTTYLEFAINYLINDSREKGQISSLIFESFIAFLGFHKEYCYSRSKNANFYVFFENGDSGYHKRIYKDYKNNRKIDKAFGLTEAELRLNRDILQKNLILIEKACNKIPNVFVIHMKNLEADFIPYYLMSRKLVPHGENVLNLTYSSDHDLYQNTLCTDNSYIYYRRKKDLAIIDKHMIIKKYMKKHKIPPNIDIPPHYYPIFIACTGDSGDDIPSPFHGAGPVTVYKHINDFVEICGGIENIYKIAYDKNQNKLIDDETRRNLPENIKMTKTIQKFIDNDDKILRNIRLMSFEVLSYYLDNYGDNNLMEQRRHIRDIIKNNTSINSNILLETLRKTKIFIDESHFNRAYLNISSNIDDIMKAF